MCLSVMSYIFRKVLRNNKIQQTADANSESASHDVHVKPVKDGLLQLGLQPHQLPCSGGGGVGGPQLGNAPQILQEIISTQKSSARNTTQVEKCQNVPSEGGVSVSTHSETTTNNHHTRVNSTNKVLLQQALENNAMHTAKIRTRRLMKEYQDIVKHSMNGGSIFTVTLLEDNLFEWNVMLHVLDTDSSLYKDMVEQNVSHIHLRLSFPDNFPFSPPFMYVASPRIENGFVLNGGAICMELLTPKGWASAYTIEAVILQFAASLVKGGARLAKKHKRNNFNKKSAQSTFQDLVRTHDKYGWVSPPKAEG